MTTTLLRPSLGFQLYYNTPAMMLYRPSRSFGWLARYHHHQSHQQQHRRRQRQSPLPSWRVGHQQQQHVRFMASVTGPIYTDDSNPNSPTVTLYTKEGCTLCDKAKEVLKELKDSHPHTLHQIDITDPEHREWWDKYKYDIPVLHINYQYWTKHRLTADEAMAALTMAKDNDGTFEARSGQPNAAAMEREKGQNE